jgi:transcription antitermination factor NusG
MLQRPMRKRILGDAARRCPSIRAHERRHANTFHESSWEFHGGSLSARGSVSVKYATALPASAASAADWFALQVWVGREQLCAKHLSVRGYEVFLPCYGERRRWTDRIKIINRALFAGYVFCRMSSDVFAKMVMTPGVLRIVGDGQRPLPVAADEIESLQRLVASGLAPEPVEFMQAGQHVRVIAGPLADCEGFVVRRKSHHCLVISVSLLRRAVAVEIDEAYVQATPATRVGGWVA